MAKLNMFSGFDSYLESQLSPENLINLYAEKDARRGASFRTRPGYLLLTDLSSKIPEKARIVAGVDGVLMVHEIGALGLTTSSRLVYSSRDYTAIVTPGASLRALSVGSGLAQIHAVRPIQGTGGGRVAVLGLVDPNGADAIMFINTDTLGFTFSQPLAVRPVTSTVLDNYILYAGADSDAVYLVGPGDYSTPSGLDVFSAESQPDVIVALEQVNGRLIVFGERTIEPFYNTGGADNPFTRVQNVRIAIGVVSRTAVARQRDTLFFVGRDESSHVAAYIMNDYTPKRVSTPAVEALLARVLDKQKANFRGPAGFESRAIDDTISVDSVSFDNHQQFIVHLNSSPDPSRSSASEDVSDLGETVSLTYDHSTGVWGQNTTRADGKEGRFFVTTHKLASSAVDFDGQLPKVIAATTSGKLCRMDRDFYGDDDEPIRPVLVSQVIYDPDNLERMYHQSVTLDMLAAQDNPLPENNKFANVVPALSFEISNDSGKTFPVTRIASLGKTGEYNNRVKFYRLGSAFKRVYRVSMTGYGRFALLEAFAVASTNPAS